MVVCVFDRLVNLLHQSYANIIILRCVTSKWLGLGPMGGSEIITDRGSI